MTYQNFKFDLDTDGIATVTWDMPDRSMNVINLTVIEELSAIVEKVAGDAAIKGAVITGGKDTFCAGADLAMLDKFGQVFAEMARTQGEEAAAAMMFEESRKLSLLYRRLETCGKPWVAAINGTAVGGGFELCLACHHRVAAANPKTRLGLPEVKVGLFPGAGGTQRIARMLAPVDALQMLLKGDQLRLDRAKALKLVNDVVPPEKLIKTAKDWINARGIAKAPWDVDGFRLPGGLVYSKMGIMTFPAANAIYRRETYDNYPAARAIMQCVYEGLQLPIDAALRVESRYFAKVLRSPEAAAMIRSLFVSMQELNKGARRPADVPPTKLKRVGIIGAGFMGAGIAYVTAQAGIEVVLIDRDQPTADKGKGHSEKLISDQVSKGRASAADRDALLARITPTADYAALSSCDLVIEAVFEDRKVKAETIAKAEAVIGDNIVFGSNTSTLPITSLAGETARRLHRRAFLLAGRQDDAGRADPRQEDRRQGARHRARLCAGDPQDPDRRQRLARLLHLARGRHLFARRPPDARRGHSGCHDRKRRPHGRHAGRPALAHRRGGGRSRVENPQSDRSRPRPGRRRRRPEEAAL
jgi:3-hydroxyacyl-CoA dehydrogenase/enoyl-CoA hydratase/3-hydroxybutyryl-CoA epimerase